MNMFCKFLEYLLWMFSPALDYMIKRKVSHTCLTAGHGDIYWVGQLWNFISPPQLSTLELYFTSTTVDCTSTELSRWLGNWSFRNFLLLPTQYRVGSETIVMCLGIMWLSDLEFIFTLSNLHVDYLWRLMVSFHFPAPIWSGKVSQCLKLHVLY